MKFPKFALCEKGPNAEFFLVRIFPLSVRIGKIRTRKYSVFGHFSRSVAYISSVTLDDPLEGFHENSAQKIVPKILLVVSVHKKILFA